MSVERTQEIMQAYWGGDAAAIAEDAVFIDIASGRRWEGREAIGDMLQLMYGELFEADFEVDKTHIGDGTAAIEGRFVGRHIGEYAGIPGTGTSVTVPLAVFYTVEDHGITEGRVWFMVSTFFEQVT